MTTKMHDIALINVLPLLYDEKLIDDQESTEIIIVPWENEEFSLQLDTHFKRFNKNTAPQTSSPLRQQWPVPTIDDNENFHISKCIDDNSQFSFVHLLPNEDNEIQQNIKKKKNHNIKLDSLLRKPKSDLYIHGDIFPYANNSNFFLNNSVIKEGIHKESDIEEPAIQNKSYSLPQTPVSGISRCRVEHISPLIPIQDTMQKPVGRRFSNTSSVITTGSSQFKYNNPLFYDSQISGKSLENWKVSKTSISSPSVYEDAITNLKDEANSYDGYFTPNESIIHQPSTVRSLVMPNNADKLILYTPESSIYAPDSMTEARPYSHYFHPTYHYKKNNQVKKRSSSLFRKLMTNIKHHFK